MDTIMKYLLMCGFVIATMFVLSACFDDIVHNKSDAIYINNEDINDENN